MAKRTVDSPWNTVGTNAWYKGWKDMAIPGTYERGIFGDLMLQAIACGVRKTLLIFNTSMNLPPIYVVNPLEFNITPSLNIFTIMKYFYLSILPRKLVRTYLLDDKSQVLTTSYLKF